MAEATDRALAMESSAARRGAVIAGAALLLGIVLFANGSGAAPDAPADHGATSPLSAPTAVIAANEAVAPSSIAPATQDARQTLAPPEPEAAKATAAPAFPGLTPERRAFFSDWGMASRRAEEFAKGAGESFDLTKASPLQRAQITEAFVRLAEAWDAIDAERYPVIDRIVEDKLRRGDFEAQSPGPPEEARKPRSPAYEGEITLKRGSANDRRLVSVGPRDDPRLADAWRRQRAAETVYLGEVRRILQSR